MEKGLEDFSFLQKGTQLENPEEFTKKEGEKNKILTMLQIDREDHLTESFCCVEKDMDEKSPPLTTNEKQMNGEEMEPSISTPLQQETKRKRSQDNETDLTKRTHQRPRKKMYRPKVIGEGRPRKSKGPSTPAKHKQVFPKPKTPRPVTPSRVLPKSRARKLRALPKPRTRKLVPKGGFQKNRSGKSTKKLEDDNQDNAEAVVSCRDLILVENEMESEKASAETAGTEVKESMEDNSDSMVIQTTAGLTERICGWFCGISHIPQECKKKRIPRRRPTKITERKLYGLSYERGKSSKLLPFFFYQRKRSPMVRRCNLAALSALPLCNQLPSNPHKHAVKSQKAEGFNGNVSVEWLSKRSCKTSVASSKFNCSSRDDDEGRKTNKFNCQSLPGLKSNDRDQFVGTAITDVHSEGMVAKESAQKALSPARFEVSNFQSEGTLHLMGSNLQNEGTWQQMGSNLQSEGTRQQMGSNLQSEGTRQQMGSNLQSEGTRQQKGSNLQSEGTKQQMGSNLQSEGTWQQMGSNLQSEGTWQQMGSNLQSEGTRQKMGSNLQSEGTRQKMNLQSEGTRQKMGSNLQSEGTRQKMGSNLQSEGTRQKMGSNLQSEGTRQKIGSNLQSEGTRENIGLNLQSEETRQKIGNLSHTQKLCNIGQLTKRWLDIRHFLFNLKILNDRSEKCPPEKCLSLTRIITGSANEMRPALDNLIFWNRRERTMNHHEHIRLTGETRAHDKGTLEEERDSFCEKILIPHTANDCFGESQFRIIPAYVGRGTNYSTGLSHDYSQKGTDWSKEQQIVPYARKVGKKTSKGEQNLSSVHGVQGAIVPHHKPLNSTKKKELGRVYLDPRNITVWNLLIQNESNFGKEKMDTNTEKWWENEREVFRGRIGAFNALLHPILGDRRFSPWKGSVLDSVVGVFLTQNVSDHLSSSAFMSLAATFPLPTTRNHTEYHHGHEVFCIQQPIVRNEGSSQSESKCNNGRMLENNKAARDPEEAEELMSAKNAIVSLDSSVSSIKGSTSKTQFPSSISLEDCCVTCLSPNLEATDNSMLHSNKSTLVQEPYSSSQSSTSSCESNQGNKILESEEVVCRNQNPISEYSNPSDTTHLLRSVGKCISQSKSGLGKNDVISNRCEGTTEVDLQFAPNETSQRFIDGVGEIQNQEVQLGDASLCVECNNQTKSGINKITEIYNYHQEKMEAGFQLSPIDDTSENLNVDIERIQSQEESIIQASDNANDIKKNGQKGTQKYLEDKNPNDYNDEKKTQIPKGKAKKSKMKPEIDWDNLQKKWDTMRRTYFSCEPRSSDYMDSVDWAAVRFAEPSKIAKAIKERGQHNIIAGRIKDFLDRIARIHGCIDLEWLRNAPPNNVKEYLLEIDGLGLKSVECIRLLALQQVAFPVDINVGRIAVRLGWVPLEPLPEEVQIHLLETFPMMDSIQKYLWPRLCTLDQRTLYELHYQLITFGKVFCTKRNPNCNACPLRADCRHYASAYASARLALPGLAEKRMVSSMVPDKSSEGTAQVMNPAPILHIDDNPSAGSRCQTNNCEPIIEEPQSPEPAYDESQLTDIEDLCEYDSDDVPIIRLSSGRFTTTSQNCLDDNTTRALVPLHTRVAPIPMRKLKHIDRLRTEHQAYELPDTHPLLFELERREPNDPCPYLLCILSPGETINLSEPPNTQCTYKEVGELCSEGSCSSCNIVRERNSGMVRGTILIPCRTAMRGKFPLNGTYFQVNEVFADDESSKNPIHVPREWIWDLPRRITYFGTSTTTIFRGLAQEDIQYCFQKGFICVRGFDRRTRTPKRLTERLHRPIHASVKARANKNEDQKQKPDASKSNSNSPQ